MSANAASPLGNNPSTFYVHIVESPSPDDLLDGRTEGKSLSAFLELAGIPCSYNLAVDRERFEVSLSDRILNAVEQFKAIPIIHLSCHGNESGIQLTDQQKSFELVVWKELASYLVPINQALGGQLRVCMSSCSGLLGRGMAKVFNPNELPFDWLVGSSSSIGYVDAALAFALFYRKLYEGMSVADITKVVKASSLVEDFEVVHGELEHRVYRAFMSVQFKEFIAKKHLANQRSGVQAPSVIHSPILRPLPSQ